MKKIKEYVTACLFLAVLFGMLAVLLFKGQGIWADIAASYRQGAGEDSSFLDRITAAIDTAETRIDQSNPLYTEFIDLNGAFQRLTGQRVVEDLNPALTVNRLDDGRMTFTVKPLETQWKAENLAGLSAWCAERGLPLLYVQAPFKIDPQDPQLPTGVTDYTNANADGLLAGLKEYGVDTLDLRQEIKRQGLDHASLFYKTDSHWTTDAAFWASETILKTLEQQYGLEIDPSALELKNYSSKVYENVFLGSQGKRVGRFYEGTDDVELLLPTYETAISYAIPIHNFYKEGSFEETVIDYSHIEPVDYYNKSPYYVYSGGDYPLSQIKNQKNTGGPKLLLVRDSFSCAVAPFLALGVGQVDTFDLRYNKQPLVEYIEESDPDAVVFLFNPGVIANDEMFRYGIAGEH